MGSQVFISPRVELVAGQPFPGGVNSKKVRDSLPPFSSWDFGNPFLNFSPGKIVENLCRGESFEKERACDT